MLFNLDKNSKQNLLNEYKQEALNYHQKKKDERQKRIQEEREYIAQREQLEKEADEKIFRERQLKKNAQMEEYQSMLMKTKNNIPGYRHNGYKNKNEIVLNNWGGQEISHTIQNLPQNKTQENEVNNSKLENNIIAQGNVALETPWRGRRGRGNFRNEDHLISLLNDNRNDQEINKYIKDEKDYKQKIYKDLLYSQFQEANNKNLNLYGTNDPLILERKRKRYLSENPFAKKDNYEFGKSTLTHNPITDPQNNMDYNKYLRFSESNTNINRRNNYQLNNNIQIQQNNYGQNMGNQNINNNNNNFGNNRGVDEFKSNNYNSSNMNMNRGGMNNNFSPIELNNQNINNNNNNANYGGNQMGQNPNNGYMNNSFRPTPSGERIRQAAASNFF